MFSSLEQMQISLHQGFKMGRTSYTEDVSEISDSELDFQE